MRTFESTGPPLAESRCAFFKFSPNSLWLPTGEHSDKNHR